MINYRKAEPGDAAELARLRSLFLQEIDSRVGEPLRAQIEEASRAYYDKALADGSFVGWLALDGESIVATSGLIFYEVPPAPGYMDGRVAYIMNVYTVPEYRKRGLATAMFDRIVGEAIARGYKKITLNATDMGRPVYEKYGFKDVKGDMVYFVD